MDKNVKYNIVLIVGFVLVLGNVFVWQGVFGIDNRMKVVFFDVGEGDSIFIETPKGFQVLIDGGPNDKVSQKLGNEMPFWDRTIDLVVLTHPDYDHVFGLLKVLANYKVKNILWAGVKIDTAVFYDWLNSLEKEKANIIVSKAGERINIGGAMMSILSPIESLEGQFIDKDINDTSAVLRVDFGEDCFLFVGDASTKVENNLLGFYGTSSEVLDCDVLKIGHHGSKTSTGNEFLESVSPELAVITVGKNNLYKHPDQAVLQRLEEFGINVVRTDLLGDVKIFADGKSLDF